MCLFIFSHTYLYLKTCFHHWKLVCSGNKTLDQRSGSKSKKQLSCWILKQISYLFFPFSAFCTKNAEKAYFDQRLESAAPQRWSKYTTNTSQTKWGVSFETHIHTLSLSLLYCTLNRYKLLIVRFNEWWLMIQSLITRRVVLTIPISQILDFLISLLLIKLL